MFFIVYIPGTTSLIIKDSELFLTNYYNRKSTMSHLGIILFYFSKGLMGGRCKGPLEEKSLEEGEVSRSRLCRGYKSQIPSYRFVS